jgi:AraC-like DNA-binding protein
MKDRAGNSSLDISVSVLSQLIRYLASLKIDFTALMRSVGLDPGLLDSPEGRIPIERYIAMENAAAAASGDPCFGLHMGEWAEPGNYSILGYLMMNARTLGEAMGKAATYYRIIGNLLSPSWRMGLGRITVILSAPGRTLSFSRHCFEAAFSGQVALLRKISGRRIDPIEVGFSAPAPESDAEYKRVFRCPVRFGRENDYMILDMSVLAVLVLEPSGALLARFEDYAKELLSKLDGEKKTVAAARRAILKRVGEPRLGLRKIAKDLAMGARTLQDKLMKEDATFGTVLSDVRANLAMRHLRDGLTVEDIACLLGYSNAGAFRKAFKQWTGMTPKEYRGGRSAG